MRWKKLGEGEFNFTYTNADQTLVLKIPKRASTTTDSPERAVRLWNELYPERSPKATTLTVVNGTTTYLGWTCPYIKGKPSTDSEMFHELINIYNRTGRIILDATSPGNFITQPDGKVLCVDLGMALQLEQREQDYLSNPKARRMSIVSLNTWKKEEVQAEYPAFFAKTLSICPKTISLIKALLFIKIFRQDIYNVDFLRSKPSIINLLARAFDAQEEQYLPDAKLLEEFCAENSEALEALLKECEINMHHIKESCVITLERYIRSRGHINTQDKFIPSLVTHIFRDVPLTTIKATDAHHMIHKIQRSPTIAHISAALQTPERAPNSRLFASNFTSGYKATIQRCQHIVASNHSSEMELHDMKLTSH